jgi:hypothetical protein
MRGVGTDRGGNGTGIEDASVEPLRMLVILRALNMDRITEGFLRCALEGGHSVHVAIEQSKDRAGRAKGEESLFDVLENEHEDFSYTILPPRRESWLYPATKLRCAIDLLRYYEPEFADAENLRRRAARNAPWYARLLAALRVLRVASLRRAIERFWRAVERRMPVSEQSLAMLREHEPDVVVVSPLVETGSPQGDHLRAADTLGIPTVLVVASWDNLTTKGVIRDLPDMTIVWNEDQVREAIELHGLPAERVLATGAHSHDHWFSWQPSTGAPEFATKVGLAPDRPFLLYVCSSGFIAGDDEVAFVREWTQRLRASGDRELEELGVLVRPHPQNFPSWRDADIDEPGRVVVWPRGGVAPTDHQSKVDYFDSLHHAKAVVGINTSALVDSAIVRRPVFTLVSEHFRRTQTGTLHFSYLAREEGTSLLNVAESWDEHFTQLGTALRSADGHREQIDGFLRAFIRPHGLETPAAPLALDAITRTALREKQPVTKGGPVRWAVGAAASALGRVHQVRDRLRKRMLRWRKRRQRKRIRMESGKSRRKGARAKPVKGMPAEKAPEAERAARLHKAERAAEKRARDRSAKPGRDVREHEPIRSGDAGARERESAESPR